MASSDENGDDNCYHPHETTPLVVHPQGPAANHPTFLMAKELNLQSRKDLCKRMRFLTAVTLLVVAVAVMAMIGNMSAREQDPLREVSLMETSAIIINKNDGHPLIRHPPQQLGIAFESEGNNEPGEDGSMEGSEEDNSLQETDASRDTNNTKNDESMEDLDGSKDGSIVDEAGSIDEDDKEEADVDDILGENATASTDNNHTNDLTFQQLARHLQFGARYQEAVQSLEILQPNVTTCEVYKMRKTILKFRDLIDVFGPIYPNPKDGHYNNNDTTSEAEEDIWTSLRDYMSQGYKLVGEFLDICHAHIMVTDDQLQKARRDVLEWNDAFTTWRDATAARGMNVTQFLLDPSDTSFRHKEMSHLFWRDVPHQPQGRDPATATLHTLGSLQVQRAISYLDASFPHDSVLQVEAQEIYHNLRKELRSILDEFELLGEWMFPTAIHSKLSLLTTVRKLLGDMNDDWTAMDFYLEHQMYPEERERRAVLVEEAWTHFKIFAIQVDLRNVLQEIANAMTPTATEVIEPPATEQLTSLQAFLEERKAHPTTNLVIGNEAGDADTVISAIALAYIESVFDEKTKTPIVSIPRKDLLHKRPDIHLLLHLSGLSHLRNTLIFVDDDFVKSHKTHRASVTLVDHNQIEDKFHPKKWNVTEIVDHHVDHGLYLDTCSGSSRTIAFEEDHALVASACTLVAERLQDLCLPPYPVTVATLLLGVILLDSVNLDPAVGKVTDRDLAAVANLVQRTDWSGLPETTQSLLLIPQEDESQQPLPNTTRFFQLLQTAKYDKPFWNSLSAEEALQYDYKDYAYGAVGISTVLMSAQDFLTKKHLETGLLGFFMESKLNVLGIMFAYLDDKQQLHRQLALLSTSAHRIDPIVGYLLAETDLDLTKMNALDSKKVKHNLHKAEKAGLKIHVFDQGNVKDSRKQIGPFILEAMLRSHHSG